MPEKRSFEVTGLFDREHACQKLLYAPIQGGCTYRETQVYHVEYEGSEAALEQFMRKVLVDAISQELSSADQVKFPKAAFVLEYGMKGGALDLEKETILRYLRDEPQADLNVIGLTLRKRIYVFGENLTEAPFVRDVCNPAIHSWSVNKLAAA